MRIRIGFALATACAIAVAACGSDNGGSSSPGNASSAGKSTGATKGAKAIDPGLMNGAKGTINYCQGKDTSGNVVAAVKKFNAMNTGVTVKLIEFSTSADEQRQQFVQRQEAKSGECDVFDADVIWTAEFASQKWIYDMTPYIKSRESEIIPATLQTATYDGKIWAVPQTTDAAFLYYRDDQVKTPPTTWQQVYEEAKANDGIVYQGAPYEGLTCDFLELAFAAGGKVLSDDGKKSEINSPANVKALQFMVDGVKGGIAANGVTTYMEEESRRYFESGKATFMRNWPYAYSLGEKKGTKVAGKFKVMPFPTFEGGGKAGILGGHNNVISVYSKNPGAALKWIDFFTGKEWQTESFDQFSLAPTIASVYDDPAIQKKYPFASELKAAVSQAKARPVSPVYPQISQAIYNNVNAALAGKVTPADAMKAADAQITKALGTF
ncbi:ABC transporter substrate-binding protein [Candidatus Solirubrobacter pratensis]|uniref:ABC transporter substrate-binding protein n=1 Tax=Candidatus Solirubrobacter pratensis TaxID=1298857 RepID=UPI00041100AC|nr:ABC transporter substrate-binding protein [Candidatus Solirubrobacter pratensis]